MIAKKRNLIKKKNQLLEAARSYLQFLALFDALSLLCKKNQTQESLTLQSVLIRKFQFFYAPKLGLYFNWLEAALLKVAFSGTLLHQACLPGSILKLLRHWMQSADEIDNNIVNCRLHVCVNSKQQVSSLTPYEAAYLFGNKNVLYT